MTTDKTYSQVQAERRAKGGDSATLADREDMIVRTAAKALVKDAERFQTALEVLAKEQRTKAAKGKGGSKKALAVAHEAEMETVVAYCVDWMLRNKVPATGRISIAESTIAGLLPDKFLLTEQFIKLAKRAAKQRAKKMFGE